MSQARSMASRTMKSLDYLHKVRCGTNGSQSYRSFNSSKVLCFVKKFSTLNSATDESFNFQNPNGFSPKTASGYRDNWSFRESNSKFKENNNGQSYNPGSLRNDFKSNPDGNSVNYDKNYRDKVLEQGSNRVYEESRNMQSSRMNSGMYQETRGNYNNGENGIFGQSPYNVNGQNTRNFEQAAGEGSGSGQHFGQISYTINGQNTRNFEQAAGEGSGSGQIPYNVNGQNTRNFEQAVGEGSGQHFGQIPYYINGQNTRNFEEAVGEGSGQHFGQSPYNVNGQNTRNFEQAAGEGSGSGQHFGQISYTINGQNTRNFEQAAGEGSGQHFGQIPYNSNGQNTRNFDQAAGEGSGQHFGQSPYNVNVQNTRNFEQAAGEGSGQHFDEKSVRVNGLNGTIDEFDAFCNEKKLKEAVEVLGLLEQRNVSLDISHYLSLMNECGESQALEEAKYVHDHLSRSTSHLDVRVCNKIMEMYAKCGSMEDAYAVFNKMGQRNLTSWDTMIMWLAKNGHGEDAIEMFTEFKKIGLKPDPQMFFGVFTACSVVGDMKEGMLHFESMIKNYDIKPSNDHYLSVVDMLGSVGYLTEALEFIEKKPVKPSVEIWEILMNHSRVHGDTELGDRCAELIELLDSTRLDENSKAGLLPIKTSDIAKEKEKKRLNPLEVKTKVYEYRAGDTSHPEHEKLYSQLRCLKQPMKEVGYVPETKFVLHDIDQESKEEALLSHSERLALSQALMTSPARSPIRIIKNLRVCGDCHNALKIISKLVGRLIVARDAKRFHHFENGVCSCGDYW